MLGAKQNSEGVNAGFLGLPSDEASGSTENTKPTVSRISLEIVRVSVKPSRIENHIIGLAPVKSTTMNHRTIVMMQVAVNDAGKPIGEDHRNAKYLDEDVERAIMFRKQGYTYQQISDMLDMPIRTVRDFVHGKRRCQSTANFKRIKRYVG